MVNSIVRRILALSAPAALPLLFAGSLLAVTATAVYTVPFQPSAPAVPHASWKNNPVTLKGAVVTPIAGHTYSYYWDPGDGVADCGTSGSPLTAYGDYQNNNGNTDAYSLGCQHTYNSSSTGGADVGLVYTAHLYVKDATAGDTSWASATYYTKIYAADPTNSQGLGNVYNLPVEVDNAIDNGLWYAHATMYRSTDTFGNNFGDWSSSGSSNNMYTNGYPGINGIDCNAFEVSGFVPNNSPATPYNDDVQRCLNSIISALTPYSISSGTQNYSGTGDFTPDQNGNGIGLYVSYGSEEIYQTGMMMDPLVSSGLAATPIPNSVNPSLPITGTGTGGAYSYKDAVLDMVDFYAYCQANGGYGTAGAWIYNCGDNGGDNSSSQWAAIGIIPAVRKFGAAFNSASKLNNQLWLSFDEYTDGSMGYRGADSFAWGPFATTPSGLVQMAMDGVGTGSTLAAGTSYPIANAWDMTAGYMRDNFANDPSSGAGSAPKAYLYGLFSFTKGMLLHDNTGGTGTPTPQSTLSSWTNAATNPPLDWYAAQSATYGGTDPTDGVARWLVSLQNSDGSWYGTNVNPYQFPMETAIAVTMLNKTVFEAVPVACATPIPSSVSNGATVTLDGTCSYDQNAPTHNLVTWQWNTSDDNNGGSPSTTFNVQPGNAACQLASCAKMQKTFATSNPLPYSYPIRLRVTNNNYPAQTADVVTHVLITTAPKPPTAVIGGPYSFCPAPYTPWTINGSASSDPDPAPSMITSYAWDFNGSNTFTSASGAVVDVTSAFSGLGGTTFNVSLKVTNNETPALSSIASTTTIVHLSSDASCSHCVTTTQAIPKAPTGGIPAQVQLYWVDTNSTAYPIDHYNVYRAANSTFTQGVTKVAGPGSGVQPIPVPTIKGAQVNFADKTVAVGQQYYYRIAPATVNDSETCASAISVGAIVPKAR
jgi:hypothetical protein